MTTPVERAVDAYIRAASEPDPAARGVLLDACWAAQGRLVTRSREISGRAAVAALLDRFHADPELLGVRVLAVDVGSRTFRIRSAVDRRDGTSVEFFDAGEIDGEGRIALILTFDGPLRER